MENNQSNSVKPESYQASLESLEQVFSEMFEHFVSNFGKFSNDSKTKDNSCQCKMCQDESQQLTKEPKDINPEQDLMPLHPKEKEMSLRDQLYQKLAQNVSKQVDDMIQDYIYELVECIHQMIENGNYEYAPKDSYDLNNKDLAVVVSFKDKYSDIRFLSDTQMVYIMEKAIDKIKEKDGFPRVYGNYNIDGNSVEYVFSLCFFD